MRLTGRDEIGGNRSAGGAFFFFLYMIVDKLAFLRAAAAALPILRFCRARRVADDANEPAILWKPTHVLETIC